MSAEHETGNSISTSNHLFFGLLYKHHMYLLTIKKNSTNNLGLRKVNALPPIHQPDRVVRKARDWAAADYIHQTQGKIFRNFTLAQLRLFSGLKMLERAHSSHQKKFLTSIFKNTEKEENSMLASRLRSSVSTPHVCHKF